jgi:tRNA nucleotidyltransferase (CCA-adding enzyme)
MRKEQGAVAKASGIRSPAHIHELLGEIPAPIVAVVRRLKEAGHQAYLAGGCVRDLLRDKHPDDYDVATSARPEVVVSLFRHVIPTGIQHGTVTVVLGSHKPHDKVEVTTFRGEGEYLDGRRPERVDFISDLDLDLARRDFTINAMALDPTTGELRDPFHGADDLAAGVVRAVGDPAARFGEDGLRTLRAVRFASVLAFEMDDATHAAIPKAITTFRKVAAERTREELTKLLLRSPEPSHGLELLRETGLRDEIFPEFRSITSDVWAHTLRVVDLVPVTTELRWAALLHDVGGDPADRDGHARRGAKLTKAILERLKHPRRVIDTAEHLVAEHAWDYSPQDSDATIRRHLARIGLDALDEFIALREANVRSRLPVNPSAMEAERDLASRLRHQRELRPPLSIGDLAVTGADIMSIAGRGPGTYVGTTLRALLTAVIEKPEENTRERLLEVALQVGTIPPR